MSIVLTGCGYGFGEFGAKNIDANVRKIWNVDAQTKNRIRLIGSLEKSKFGTSLVNPLTHYKQKKNVSTLSTVKKNKQIL